MEGGGYATRKYYFALVVFENYPTEFSTANTELLSLEAECRGEEHIFILRAMKTAIACRLHTPNEKN